MIHYVDSRLGIWENERWLLNGFVEGLLKLFVVITSLLNSVLDWQNLMNCLLFEFGHYSSYSEGGFSLIFLEYFVAQGLLNIIACLKLINWFLWGRWSILFNYSYLIYMHPKCLWNQLYLVKYMLIKFNKSLK